jgi:lipopolysaccharide export system permease protein
VFMLFIAGVELTARPLRLEASLLRIHETAPAGNLLRRSGFWIRTGQMYINVAELQDVRGPGDIRMFDFTEDAHLASYLRAASADVIGTDKWHLENVWRKRYAPDGAPAAPETYAEFDWTPTWDRTTRLYDLPIACFTIAELISRVQHHANESVGAQAERSELWRRITLPLAAIAYALLAAPFALLANIRGGRSTRLAIGVALAFLVYIGQQVASNAGILAGLAISVTSVVPPLVVLIFALLLMRRMD